MVKSLQKHIGLVKISVGVSRIGVTSGRVRAQEQTGIKLKNSAMHTSSWLRTLGAFSVPISSTLMTTESCQDGQYFSARKC